MTLSLRVVAPVLAVGLLVSGCSSSPDDKPDPSASKGSSEKLVQTSPLTGQPLKNGRPDNPVFVVKVENTDHGEPQYGLNRADLVVEELVEGGLTRLAAMYYSTLPDKVGHVRSLRDTDVGIAAPVTGQVVATGGAPGTIRRVKRAGMKFFTSPGFSNDPAKARPYNRLVNLSRLAKATKATKIPGPYLGWAPPDSSTSPSTPATKTATKASVRFSRSVTTRWALKGDTWQRTNGHAAKGQDFAADTLVVMFAKVGDAGYTDPAGNPVPETQVRGSGRAVLLHGKDVTEATWTKKDDDSTITFADSDGKPLRVDPGRAWLELVPRGDGKLTLR